MLTCRIFYAIVAASCAIAVAASSQAQVLELGAGGVTVYDRPFTFSQDGASPIALQAPPGKAARPIAASPALLAGALSASLSPDLVEAVAWRESRGRHGLVSRRGAVGEMQLTPGTARAMKVDATNAEQNYRGGATYLAVMLKRYDGDLERALAAYNAGPGAVDRHRGVPPYRETKAYVAAVMDRLSRRAEALDE